MTGDVRKAKVLTDGKTNGAGPCGPCILKVRQ